MITDHGRAAHDQQHVPLLADDERLVRSGFKVLLDLEEDITVVGEATNGAEAVELARGTRPDVVLMDIRMPQLDGILATARITETVGSEQVRVLILTTYDTDDNVFEALQAGASGFLLKDAGPGELLLQLIARFCDVDAGAVRVGGVDIRAIDTAYLISQISFVFQHVYLFDGTIEDNVRLGRPDATDAQVRAAASAARLDEVVERLPEGWNTDVGEGGALLSGGERQRVSIARALLEDAPIVLLDEVSSALDPVNEAAVHEGIERLLTGRTVVLIAHRLRTVQRADRVVFLDRGRIVEDGSHDELLRRGGRYADFWKVAMAPSE